MDVQINNKQINTYRDLLKTLQHVLYSAWGKNSIKFISAYPKDTGTTQEVQTPIITYRCRKTPANQGSNTEIKPRVRDTIRIKNKYGEEISCRVNGQLFKIIMTFEIWGADGDEADSIADRFEQFMATYSDYFISSGCGNVLFLERDDGQQQHQWRTDLIKRTLTYQFTIDQITSIELDNISGIEIDAVVYSNTFTMLVADDLNKKKD